MFERMKEGAKSVMGAIEKNRAHLETGGPYMKLRNACLTRRLDIVGDLLKTATTTEEAEAFLNILVNEAYVNGDEGVRGNKIAAIKQAIDNVSFAQGGSPSSLWREVCKVALENTEKYAQAFAGVDTEK